MAYNIPERYSDLTPAAKLDKKTLNKMVWMSCFLQASFNYERMQACGWLWGILPGLKKDSYKQRGFKGFHGSQPGLPEYAPVPGNLCYGYRIISGTEQG